MYAHSQARLRVQARCCPDDDRDGVVRVANVPRRFRGADIGLMTCLVPAGAIRSVHRSVSFKRRMQEPLVVMVLHLQKSKTVRKHLWP